MTFKSFFTISALTLSALTWNSVTHSAQEISTMAQFNAEVIASPKPVVVKFSAPWCGPCKTMAPMFEAVSKEAAFQGVKFVQVNTDTSPIASSYNVRSVPTTIFFKNGKEVGRINGGPSKTEFVNKIKSYFAI